MSEVSVDRSQYYDLIKEIQNEIKEKIITKLLTQIQQQDKELTMYKKENNLLKNQLTYVLKRVILNKNDFSTVIKNNRIKNVGSVLNKNNSAIIHGYKKGSNNSLLRPLKSVENYRCVTEGNLMNGQEKRPERNNSSTNLNGGDYNYNVDNKVSGYLNSLYRHNFVNNNKQFLNKKESLYDELFTNKNNSYILNTEQSEGSQKNNLRYNSMDKRKNKLNNKSHTSKIGKINKINKNDYTSYKGKVKLNLNYSAKKRINYTGANGSDNGAKYSKTKFSTVNNATQKKPRKVNYPKRSPFIANKF